MDLPTVAVNVPALGDERRKNWAKVVVSVDDAKASGWAYDGPFVATGGIQDVAVGAVLLVYGEKGSRASPQIEARVYRVNADATLTEEAVARGRAWARTLRDRVADMVESAGPPSQLEWSPELMRYTEAALREELDRRSDG